MENDQNQTQEVLSWLEERLRHGEFSIVDLWLENADTNCLNSSVIIAALSITFWGKDKLTKREGFLALAEPILKERLGEERANKLLLRRR